MNRCFSSFWVKLIAAYMFFFLLFSAYFLLPSFTSLDDQFFNIKFAELIKERGIDAFSHFDWFSGVGSYAWNANILFYLSLIPFTFFEPLELGIKFYAIASVSFGFSVLYYFFSVLRMRFAFFSSLLVLAIFLTPTILHHFLTARAFVVLPALLLLELSFLLRKRYVWVAVISFLYFFWHSATAFFPLMLAVAYSVALILERKPWNRWIIFAPLSGVVCAVLTGELFFPGFVSGFWKNFTIAWTTIIESGFSRSAVLQEGIEVYPFNFFDLYGSSPILLLLFIFFLVRDLMGYIIRQRAKSTLLSSYDVAWGTLFLLSVVSLLGSLITRRMSDFFYVFSSVFLLYCLRPYINTWTGKSSTAFAMGTIIFVGLLSNLLFVGDMIAQTGRHTGIKGAAEWLIKNSERGSTVFNPTMNYFPTFFFFNGYHNRFIIGIEPRLLHEADQEKYWLWYHISNEGSICDKRICDVDILSGKSAQEKGLMVASTIKTEFLSQFVIISGEFSALIGVIDGSTAFQKVYTDPLDGYYRVYFIRPE